MLWIYFFPLFFWMLVGHAVADYPLQGDFLAKAKNRMAPIPGISWKIALGAHAMIHAGAVVLITRSYLLGLVELVLHIVIDDAKCRGITTFTEDQALHVVCKVFYAGILIVAAYSLQQPSIAFI